jgi:MGT family glycosyltransferase
MAAGDGVDAVVVDYMATSGLNGAQALGLPTAALVHTLYVDLLADGAPFPMGMAASVDTLNEERAGLGLQPLRRLGDLFDAVDLVMVTAPRELDGPGEVPDKVHYTGPLVPSAGAHATWTPPTGDGPLVVASMGTAGTGQAPVVQRVIDALAPLPVRGFVTVPSYVARDELTVPDNVVVSGYVPHAAVMPHADLVVTHAGLGTITAALAWGVPLVCIPEDREQPNNAAAVARMGVGQSLDRDADPQMIGAAIKEGLAAARPDAWPSSGRAVELVESLI